MAQTPKLFLIAYITIASLLAATHATADDSRELKVDEQPLSDALKIIANEFGVDIAFFPEATDGLDGIALVGSYTSGEAFDALLEDTKLEYQALDNGTVVVRAKNQGGDSDSKNLSPAPILIAQNQTNQTSATSSGQSNDGGTSIVTGKVMDARTGANLKGAKVTIEETGQWTSTNNLGEFRFVNVPTGSATLTVSFLGYAGQSAVIGVRGDSTSRNFTLRGGSEIEEIVVLGRRSARAIALNQERVADNVATVLSSDSLGNFSGSTISDALRKAPGVTFQQDFGTADGINIIVRGLQPDLNSVKLDGVELPVVDGFGRAPNLSAVLADSVDKVTINKTLTAAQDSSGTGGLIEIETKGPLDRPARFAEFSVEHSWDDLDLDENIFTGVLSTQFGENQNFGVSVAAQYRDFENVSTSYSTSLVLGEYLPLGPTGAPTISSRSYISPAETFPFEPGAAGAYPESVTVGQSLNDQEVFSATLTAQALINDHTDVRLSYQRTEAEGSSAFVNARFSNRLDYSLLPVESLGGELRYALGQASPTGGYSASQSYSLRQKETKTDLISLQGKTQVSLWSFRYLLGYTKGKQEVPGDFSFSWSGPNTSRLDWEPLISATAVDPVEGRIISVFPRLTSDSRLAIPALNQDGFVAISDTANYRFGRAAVSGRSGSNERLAADLMIRREFASGPMNFLEAGINYEQSEFDAGRADNNIEYTRNSSVISVLNPSDFSLSFDNDIFVPLSVPNISWFAADPANIASLLTFLEVESRADAPLINRSVIATVGEFGTDRVDPTTEETEVASFLQAKFQFGKAELLAGVRVSSFEINSSRLVYTDIVDENFITDQAFRLENARFATDSVTQTEVLPRILANYRFNETTIARLGYFRSIARPSIVNLTNTEAVVVYLSPFFSPNFDRPSIFVTTGNPDLKPARTDNYDLSIEKYFESAGVVKLGLFYKRINDPLRTQVETGIEVLDSIDLPDDPRIPNPSDAFIQSSKPVNNIANEEIWGVEVAIEKQFVNLKGWFSGFGVYANATYTDGETDERIQWLFSPVFDVDGNVVDFQEEELLANNLTLRQQPEWSGTLGVTYGRDNLDAILSYTYRDRYPSQVFAGYGLAAFRDEVDSLDFRAEYLIETGWSGPIGLYVEGNDLLRSSDEAVQRRGLGGQAGAGSFITGQSFSGG